MLKRVLLVLSAVLLLTLGAGWYAVFYTPYGVELLVAQLGKLKNMRMSVAGASGTLAGGLTVERFELDHRYVDVRAENIRLTIVPRALFAQTLRAESLVIGNASVTSKPVDDSPSTTPPRFFMRYFLLQADDVQIERATYTHYNGFTQTAQRLKGRARITASRLQLDGLAVETDQFSAGGEFAMRAQRPLALSARFDAQLFAPYGDQLTGVVELGGDIETMHIDATLREPNAAVVKSTFARRDDSWRLTGSVNAAAFSLAPWLERPPFSLQQVALEFSYDPSKITANGSLIVPELDTTPLLLDAEGRYEDRVLTIKSADIRLQGHDTQAIASGIVTFGDGRPDIAAQVNWRQVRWPLSSAPQNATIVSPLGAASLRGRLQYDVTAEAEVVTRDIPIEVKASGTVDETRVDVRRFALALLGGEATGNGSLNLQQKTWQAHVDAMQLDLSELYAPLIGRVGFSVIANGAGYDRNARISILLPSFQGRLRDAPLQGKGEAAHDKSGWTVKQVALSWGDATLSLSGTYTNRIDLQWALNAPTLDTFFPDAHGSLQTEGALRGSYELPHIDATLRGDNLVYGSVQIASVSARIDTHPAGDDDSQLQARFRELRLGRLSLGSPTITADMNGERSRVTLDKRQQWVLDRFCIHWPEALDDGVDRRLCGNAQWARSGAWSVRADSNELPLSLFNDSVPQDARYGGTWQARVRADATPTVPVRGEAVVRIADATLAFQTAEGEPEILQLGNGQISLLAEAQEFIAAARVETPGTTVIDASARIERRADVAWNESPLRGALRGHTADANLIPLMFPDIDHSAGKLDADLDIRGTVSLPEITGRVQLADGELGLYRYNLNLRNMNVDARFVDNRLDFKGSALAGDGSMNIDGELAWENLEPKGQLHFTGDRLTVADLPEYKILASPDVRFVIDNRRIDISGEVLIPTARLQLTDLSGATQLSPDARLTSTPPSEKSRGFDIHSEVTVRIGDDVTLDTMGLQGQLGGTVTTIARPNDRAIGRGELSVVEGKYEAYGQKLEISRGRLLFNQTPLDDPGLDIQAARQIEEQRVGVNVRGTLRAPRMTLFAEPSLTQTQIVSYLLTGKPVDDLKAQDRASVGVARNDLALQGGGVLASQLGRRLGIEEVGIESRGLNDTSLVLGKFLSPRLFVSYGISLTESINTVKLRYTISDKWRFKSEVGQNQSADLEFRIER